MPLSKSWAPQPGREPPLPEEDTAWGTCTWDSEEAETASQEPEEGRLTSLRSPHVWGVKWWQESWIGTQKTCVEVPALIKCAAFTILSLSFHICYEHKYHPHLPCRVTLRNTLCRVCECSCTLESMLEIQGSMKKIVRTRYLKIFWGGSAGIFHLIFHIHSPFSSVS